MKKLLTVILLLALTAPAYSQTTQRLTASKASEYALVYSLPLTEFDITLQTRHTRRVPGPFYNYARRHLAITDAITKESSSVELEQVVITPRGAANPANRWMVQFKSGSSPFILLNPEGVPLAVNTDLPAKMTSKALPEAQAAEPTILESEVARQAMTQDMIRSSSTSKRAELAAARIFELRDTRSELLSGQADNPPADGRAMQLVLDNLAAQEKALTAMFAGTEQTWTEVATFTATPDSTGLAEQVLARVSPYEGILDADNLAGAPVSVAITITSRTKLPVNEKGEEKKFPKGGFAYCLPGTALIEVKFEGRTVASQEFPVAQAGVVFGLDPAVFTDKKAPSLVRLDPTTGAVLELVPLTPSAQP